MFIYLSRSRDQLMQLLIESFNELAGNSRPIDYNLFVLTIASLISVVSKNVKSMQTTHSADVYERINFNQSKWTEVLIDFLLNIKENKVATKAEFLTTFSYNKIFPVETLKFVYELFRNTTIHFYFLAKIQPSCIQLKISSYLLQYLHSTQLDRFESSPGSIVTDTNPFVLGKY